MRWRAISGRMPTARSATAWELQATLQLEVYSPGRRAGALCERAAAQVVDVFLGGIEGLYSGDLELGRTAYDARTDCFRCAVRAPLTLRLYTTAQDGAFTHADIRGYCNDP